MSFAVRLREAMDLRELTQAELATKAGMTQGGISYILAGERSPGLDVAVGLARALEVSLDWLCDLPERRPGQLLPDEDELLRAFREVAPSLRRTAVEALKVYPRRQ